MSPGAGHGCAWPRCSAHGLVPALRAGRGPTGLCRVLRALLFVTADLCDHALHIPHDEL